jgi:hypothetical protein
VFDNCPAAAAAGPLQGVSKVIVRPSLISGLAGDPYPGFINNFAGSPGFMMGEWRCCLPGL